MAFFTERGVKRKTFREELHPSVRPYLTYVSKLILVTFSSGRMEGLLNETDTSRLPSPFKD
jgi:hypothetical protein